MELAILQAQPGDKVRLKFGIYVGARGIIEALNGSVMVVRLDDGGSVVRVHPQDVTNFSLAARKAWVTGPDRAVGRKKGAKLKDRVTVTFRIDRELWEEFMIQMEAGRFTDRNAVVNEWFREMLAKVKRRAKQVGDCGRLKQQLSE